MLMPCLETILRSMYLKENSINLDERFGGDTDIPANPKTKKYIESGKGIIVDVQSSLHSTARFAIYKNPAKGSKQDKVIMATISDPKRGKVKMFAFHGSHVSHQKAMDFAAKHKLIALKDKDGNRLHSKYESVELDERTSGPTRMAIDKEFTKMTRSGSMDTMAAIKHVEKMFKVKNVKVAKDKRGKPYVISFNESFELEEKAVPVHQYKNMMKWYETSPERKVYDILDRKGWRIPADGFTLVQNMVKKNAGNAKKAADEIMKRYPNFQMESVEQLDEMDPKEHVRLNKSTGMYCVYNKDGEKVKEFKDKADADKWATDNHDSLMESMKDVIKKVAGSVLGKKRKPAKWRKDQKSPLVKLGQGDFQRTIRPKDIK